MNLSENEELIAYTALCFAKAVRLTEKDIGRKFTDDELKLCLSFSAVKMLLFALRQLEPKE